MKYRLEYPPNENCLTVHIDRRVTEKMIVAYDHSGAKGLVDDGPIPEYVKNIFALAGIETVYLHQHSVGLMKGEMFSWEEMLPLIIFAIKSEFDPEGEAIEQAAPRRWRINDSGFQEDIDLVSEPSDDIKRT